VWCGVVWCGVVWCGVVWCGVVWCGVVWYLSLWFFLREVWRVRCNVYLQETAQETSRGSFLGIELNHHQDERVCVCREKRERERIISSSSHFTRIYSPFKSKSGSVRCSHNFSREAALSFVIRFRVALSSSLT